MFQKQNFKQALKKLSFLILSTIALHRNRISIDGNDMKLEFKGEGIKLQSKKSLRTELI